MGSRNPPKTSSKLRNNTTLSEDVNHIDVVMSHLSGGSNPHRIPPLDLSQQRLLQKLTESLHLQRGGKKQHLPSGSSSDEEEEEDDWTTERTETVERHSIASTPLLSPSHAEKERSKEREREKRERMLERERERERILEGKRERERILEGKRERERILEGKRERKIEREREKKLVREKEEKLVREREEELKAIEWELKRERERDKLKESEKKEKQRNREKDKDKEERAKEHSKKRNEFLAFMYAENSVNRLNQLQVAIFEDLKKEKDRLSKVNATSFNKFGNDEPNLLPIVLPIANNDGEDENKLVSTLMFTVVLIEHIHNLYRKTSPFSNPSNGSSHKESNRIHGSPKQYLNRSPLPFHDDRDVSHVEHRYREEAYDGQHRSFDQRVRTGGGDAFPPARHPQQRPVYPSHYHTPYHGSDYYGETRQLSPMNHAKPDSVRGKSRDRLEFNSLKSPYLQKKAVRRKKKPILESSSESSASSESASSVSIVYRKSEKGKSRRISRSSKMDRSRDQKSDMRSTPKKSTVQKRKNRSSSSDSPQERVQPRKSRKKSAPQLKNRDERKYRQTSSSHDRDSKASMDRQFHRQSTPSETRRGHRRIEISPTYSKNAHTPTQQRSPEPRPQSVTSVYSVFKSPDQVHPHHHQAQQRDSPSLVEKVRQQISVNKSPDSRMYSTNHHHSPSIHSTNVVGASPGLVNESATMLPSTTNYLNMDSSTVFSPTPQFQMSHQRPQVTHLPPPRPPSSIPLESKTVSLDPNGKSQRPVRMFSVGDDVLEVEIIPQEGENAGIPIRVKQSELFANNFLPSPGYGSSTPVMAARSHVSKPEEYVVSLSKRLSSRLASEYAHNPATATTRYDDPFYASGAGTHVTHHPRPYHTSLLRGAEMSASIESLRPQTNAGLNVSSSLSDRYPSYSSPTPVPPYRPMSKSSGNVQSHRPASSTILPSPSSYVVPGSGGVLSSGLPSASHLLTPSYHNNPSARFASQYQYRPLDYSAFPSHHVSQFDNNTPNPYQNINSNINHQAPNPYSSTGQDGMSVNVEYRRRFYDGEEEDESSSTHDFLSPSTSELAQHIASLEHQPSDSMKRLTVEGGVPSSPFYPTTITSPAALPVMPTVQPSLSTSCSLNTLNEQHRSILQSFNSLFERRSLKRQTKTGSYADLHGSQ